MKTRLSSYYLYHFTRNFKTIKLILQNGFRHSLISELRPNSSHLAEDVTITESANGIPMKAHLNDKHNLKFTDEDLIEIRHDKAELKK